MNKNFLLALSLILTLTFSACGKPDVDPSFTDSSQEISFTGLLQSKPASSSILGTHILILADGQEIPVRSVALNLSSADYLGNKVTIQGVKGSDNVYTVTGISVLEKISPSVQQNADPVEYKNSDLGFLISQFPEWQVEETINSVRFFKSPSSTETSVTGTQEVLDETLPTASYFSVTQEPFSFEHSVFDTEEQENPLMNFTLTKFPDVNFNENLSYIGVDSYETVEIDNEDGASNYYLYRNGLIYHISYLAIEEDDNIVLSKMLASFRLIGFTADGFSDLDKEVVEQVSTNTGSSDESPLVTGNIPAIDTEFTSFSSTPFKFTGTYPKSWYYVGERGDQVQVLHRYRFSTEEITDSSALITMEILREIPTDGQRINLDGRQVYKVSDGAKTTFYFEAADRRFSISGARTYDDIMLNMLNSITKTE